METFCLEKEDDELEKMEIMKPTKILIVVISLFVAVALFSDSVFARNVEDLSQGDRITQRQNKIDFHTQQTEFSIEAIDVFGRKINTYSANRIQTPHNELRYGFTFQGRNPEFVRFIINSNTTLHKKGNLMLVGTEQVTTKGNKHTDTRTTTKQIVFNFNELQQKNPNGELTLDQIAGIWFIDAWNITDWDPVVSHTFNIRIDGAYNNTEFAEDQEGIRLKKDLIFYVPFENTNRSDVSFNNLIPTGDGTQNTTNGFLGTTGESFDGITDEIKYNVNPERLDVNSTENFTISAYIEPSPWDGERDVFISRRAATGWVLQIAVNSKFSFFTDHGATQIDCYSDTNVSDGLPHLVTAVYHSNKTKEIWVDGVHENTCSVAPWGEIAANGVTTYIGSAGGSNRFTGLIDDVRIYKRALNVTEIIQLNNSIQLNKVVAKGNFTSPSIASDTNITSWRNVSLNCHIYDNRQKVISGCTDNTSVEYRLSEDNITWGDWSPTTLQSTDFVINKVTDERFLQYRIHLNTSNLSLTPLVQGVNISYGDGQVPPTVNSVVINTTKPTTNSTSQNVTSTINITDLNDDYTKPIYNWLLNGSSIAVLNMPFEEDGLYNTTDFSGNGNNGSTSNVAHNTTSGFDGNGTYQFHGTATSYIQVDDFKNWPNETITTAFWVKTGGAGDGLLSYATPASDNTFLIFDQSAITIYIRGVPTATAVSVNDNLWHHLAVTWQDDNNTMRIYKDGVLEFSGLVVNTAMEKDGCFVIAQESDSVCGGYDGSQAMPGNMDDLIIYDRILSQEQVQALYLNRTDLIVSQETQPGNNWTLDITGTDLVSNGSSLRSNSVIITDGSLPPRTGNFTLTLTSPLTQQDTIQNNITNITLTLTCIDADCAPAIVNLDSELEEFIFEADTHEIMGREWNTNFSWNYSITTDYDISDLAMGHDGRSYALSYVSFFDTLIQRFDRNGTNDFNYTISSAQPFGIEVDNESNMYVITTVNFGADAFITKIDESGNSIYNQTITGLTPYGLSLSNTDLYTAHFDSIASETILYKMDRETGTVLNNITAIGNFYQVDEIKVSNLNEVYVLSTDFVDTILQKFDTDFNGIWNLTQSGLTIGGIETTRDGNILISNYDNLVTPNIAVTRKINRTDATTIWDHNLSGQVFEIRAQENIYLLGTNMSSEFNTNLQIVKLDLEGNHIWNYTDTDILSVTHLALRPNTLVQSNGTPMFTLNNPQEFTLNEGQAINVSWLVNMTGNIGQTVDFFGSLYRNNISNYFTNNVSINIIAAPVVADPNVTAFNITLLNPANAFSFSIAALNHSCLVGVNTNITNVSLMGNWSGVFDVNSTNTSGTLNVTYTFPLTVPNGHYSWNCKACDSVGTCDNAPNNFTYIMNVLSPFNFGTFRYGLEHITLNYTTVNESTLNQSICMT